ncbi:MFS transporter [Mucilaginibacter sp. X5P1]|uniref:MFS transporter n=1 Tax=Mucilaginibacter sp. X5P1 TaxID=2723088 RepID=UPI00160B807E|nr:MFS transporter [Mucilaginibacter sp. X5P1]MBB6141641.1 MFS family permease [Mucilaginibacter sp. X5P1]
MSNLPKSSKTSRIAAAIFFFISGFGYTTWASRIPSIQRDLHLNEAQLGIALFALPVGLMATMPLTGKLLSRFSSSAIMLFGAVSYNLCLGLLGYATQFWQFLLILFFFGSSRNLFNLSTNTEAVGVQTLYSKSIMTTFHGIWSMAGFGGAALGYLMVADHIKPAYHLLSVSIILTVIAFCCSPFLLHQKPVPQPNKPIFSLPDKTLLKLSFICFASMACENIMYDWSGIYMDKAVHTSHAIAITGFIAFMSTLTFARFAGDKVVTRYGVKMLMQYSGMLIISGFMLSVIFPYLVTAILGFAMVGIGTSCIVPLVYREAGKSKTMSNGLGIAAVSTVGYLGFLIVPPLVGFVAQASNLRWSFAIISTLGLVIVWMSSKLNNSTNEITVIQ